MTRMTFHSAAALLATAALALSGASLAHAEPASGGGSTGQHESCTQGDTEYPDGYVSKWKDSNGNRGSTTCTNGTICTSTGWKNQTTGQMSWTYACKGPAAMRATKAKTTSRPVARG